MIRLILMEIALFLLPFLLYGIYLFVRRARKTSTTTHEQRAPSGVLPQPYGLLAVLGLTLVAISFVGLALFSEGKPGEVYRPSHYQDGKLVRGGFETPPAADREQ